MRPITIMSIIYRMWASTRLRQLKVWQEAWCSPSQHGFRVGHGCEDVLWRFGLLIEDALVGGGEIFTVHYDFAKCFDSIPHEVTLRLAEELGMPKGICRAMSSMYKGLDRHFRVPGGMGEGFRATNGILQGCPISVVLVNVLLVVWLRDLGSLNIEGLAVGLYADDVSAKTSTIRDIARISSSLCEFCSRTGLRINAKKSCWCTCPHRPEKVACSAEDLPLTWECNGVTLHESRGKRALLVDGEMIPQVGAATCLGANLRVDPETAPVMDRRIERATGIAQRLARLPLTLGRQAEVAGMLVLPTGLYGGIVEEPNSLGLRRFARAVDKAVAGNNAMNLRATELSLSLIRKGHVVDPGFFIRYNRLLTWRRLCVKGFDDVRMELTRCRAAAWPRTVGSGVARGPAALFAQTLSDIGWRWSDVTTLDIPGRLAGYLSEEKRSKLGLGAAGDSEDQVGWTRLNLEEVKSKAQVEIFAHLIREALRRWRWSAFAESGRRPRLWGIGGGIDKLTTSVILHKAGGNTLPAYEEGFLRQTLCDGQHAKDRRARSAEGCAYCSTRAPETVEHLFWDCQRWNDTRSSYARAVGAQRSNWPPCLSLCGILPTVRRHTGSAGAQGEAAVTWDCSEVDRLLLWEVQRMMVAVVAARKAVDDSGQEEEESRMLRIYPFSYQVAEATTRPNNLRRSAPRGWASSVYGETLRMAIAWYLGQLRWGTGAEFSLCELAIDFAVVTGCDICPLKQGETDDGVHHMRRVRCWGRACGLLAKAEPGALPDAKMSRWLYRLGGPREKRQCFVERPELCGRTTDALRDLGDEMRKEGLRQDRREFAPPLLDGVLETEPALVLRSDGAARENGVRSNGHPRMGACGIGFAVWRGEEEIFDFRARLADGATNVKAEFLALIAGFRWLLHLARGHGRRIEAQFICDCEPVVSLTNGMDKSKTYATRQPLRVATGLLEELRRHGTVTLVHRLRELNTRADALANEGCDLPEVTTSWPVWHEAAAAATSSKSSGGREAGGWQGSKWGEFCLSKWMERPASRPWEEWIEDIGEAPHRDDSPRRVARNALRRAEYQRRAGEPEAPA